MKHRVFSLAVTLGLVGMAPVALAQSAALQKAQEAAAEVDLSELFTARTDARSQSFKFGGTHEHAFTVDKPGRYVFTSDTLPGESDDYYIKASLLDARGNVIASDDAQGQDGGLRLAETLEPGDYVLRVNANKFGSRATGGSSYTVSVAGLDASGERLASDESGIDGGPGIQFDADDDDGATTAFVRDKKAVATIAAPAATAGVGGSAAGASSRSEASAANSGAASSQAGTKASPRAFDEIVADIKIRQRGEVLSFDVAQAGTVSVTSSTFPGSEGTYRLEARLLDENGNVVARDEGEGFEGDFAIESVLQPGRYTVWVNGQKFGAATSGVNNYTLRIQQLDTR